MKKTSLLLASSVGLALLSGCGSLANRASAPNEFRVVTKAPLVVPPDYNLRPPTPGQAQPFEVDPARAGTASAFGTSVGADASAAERALVAAAGANSVSPVIRQQVDFEEARVIRKSSDVTDRVISWEAGSEADTGGDSATGNKPVEIERGRGERIKLPGT